MSSDFEQTWSVQQPGETSILPSSDSNLVSCPANVVEMRQQLQVVRAMDNSGMSAGGVCDAVPTVTLEETKVNASQAGGELNSERVSRLLERANVRLTDAQRQQLNGVLNALSSGQGMEAALRNLPVSPNGLEANLVAGLQAVLGSAGYQVRDESGGRVYEDGSTQFCRGLLISRGNSALRISDLTTTRPGQAPDHLHVQSLCEIRPNGSSFPVTNPEGQAAFQRDFRQGLNRIIRTSSR
jgi:hypothetical protein